MKFQVVTLFQKKYFSGYFLRLTFYSHMWFCEKVTFRLYFFSKQGRCGFKKINTKALERRRKKKARRQARKKLSQCSKQKGKCLTLIIYQTINHYFPDLFERMREIEDYRKKSEYELAELITACIAMFLFKEGSRNAFNNDRKEENFEENYNKFFKMKLPHMDTVDNVMRRLEESELEKLKASMIKNLLVKKSLHKFRLFGRYFIVAVDGTGVHSYSERHCDQCLTKTSSKTGKTTYFHNVLEAKLICPNGFSISLATEWIENPEGDFDKQDCEQKAFKRLAVKLKKEYPRLQICIATDGLYPNLPFFDLCRKHNWRCIVTFKKGNLPSVWDKVHVLQEVTKDNTCNKTVICKGKKICSEYCWINAIDYHGHKLNWIECVESSESMNSGKTESAYFVHLTDMEINWNNAPTLSHTGRLRWKIENEGFNTQKNLGYNMKHKYSRSTYSATKNYYQCLQIAHLINQLVELSSNCKKLLESKVTVKDLWKYLIGFFTYKVICRKELSELSQLRIQIRLE